MAFSSLRRLVNRSPVSSDRATRKKTGRSRWRPVVETLEDRYLLTSVTNLDDAGPGSLRQAIIDTPPAGTVDFDPALTGTITLTSAPLTINKVLHIVGPGSSIITVSGNNARQDFIVQQQFTVMISGLTIAYGNAGGGGLGGGISNNGNLAVSDCAFTSNFAGAGGAFVNTGTMTLANSVLSGNSGLGASGAVDNTGSLTVNNSTLNGNTGGEFRRRRHLQYWYTHSQLLRLQRQLCERYRGRRHLHPGHFEGCRLHVLQQQCRRQRGRNR